MYRGYAYIDPSLLTGYIRNVGFLWITCVNNLRSPIFFLIIEVLRKITNYVNGLSISDFCKLCVLL